MANFGFLVPTGGGEDIPLKKDRILVGRRDNCDIVLRFANVSGQHCRLTLEQGYWFVKDLDSRNGTKVNGYRVARKRLDPGVILTIAKHQYEIRYNPIDLVAKKLFGSPLPSLRSSAASLQKKFPLKNGRASR